MELELRYDQMESNMKDIEKRIWLIEKEDLLNQMQIIMKENSEKIGYKDIGKLVKVEGTTYEGFWLFGKENG